MCVCIYKEWCCFCASQVVPFFMIEKLKISLKNKNKNKSTSRSSKACETKFEYIFTSLFLFKHVNVYLYLTYIVYRKRMKRIFRFVTFEFLNWIFEIVSKSKNWNQTTKKSNDFSWHNLLFVKKINYFTFFGVKFWLTFIEISFRFLYLQTYICLPPLPIMSQSRFTRD